MKENLKKFLEEASRNEELKAKLAALTDKDTAAEKAIGIAKEYGYTLTAEDFEPDEDEDDNLSLDEMGQVAGGAGCVCGVVGCATSGSGSGACICVLYGLGY